MDFTVVIPTFYEVKTINEILKQVQNTGLVGEIIVVDDDSKEDTWDLLAE